MKDPTLLLDVSYLAHRAFHTMGDLAYGSEGTGAIFGIFKDIQVLQQRFGTGRLVFAFDHPAPKHREHHCPGYKSTRRQRYAEESEDEQRARRDFRGQLRKLYRQYLPAAGFANVFAAAGFEADDIIARVARNIPAGEEAIIVSSDEDLWQCLSRMGTPDERGMFKRPQISCWNPQKAKLYTATGFEEQWGFPPALWARVKAIAGCKTDDVPGVPGVGEVTAAKYVRGELGTHTKAYAKIQAFDWRANKRIVKLPYEGTPNFDLRDDEVTEEKWQAVADALGMASLRGHVPTTTGKTRGRKPNERQKAKGFGLNR